MKGPQSKVKVWRSKETWNFLIPAKRRGRSYLSKYIWRQKGFTKQEKAWRSNIRWRRWRKVKVRRLEKDGWDKEKKWNEKIVGSKKKEASRREEVEAALGWLKQKEKWGAVEEVGRRIEEKSWRRQKEKRRGEEEKGRGGKIKKCT